MNKNMNLNNTIQKNKDFIKHVHMLFMHYYNIESQVLPYNINIRIERKINNELYERGLLNILDFDINIIHDCAYQIIIRDKKDQKWTFEVEYSEIDKINLVACYRQKTNYLISNNPIESYICIVDENDEVLEKIVFFNKKLSKEQVDYLSLKYDITIPNEDTREIIFENPQILDFVKSLK